jgi:hypothetical protein
MGLWWEKDCIAGPNNGRGWLQEEQGDIGDLNILLTGVSQVIAPHTDNLAGYDGSQQTHIA